MVPEIWSINNRIFCHFGEFLSLLPPLTTKKSKSWKNEKKTLKYYYQSVVYNLRTAPRIFKERHFWWWVTQKGKKGHFFVKYYKGQCPTNRPWFLMHYSLYYHFTHVHHKQQLACNRSSPQKTKKIKILKM